MRGRSRIGGKGVHPFIEAVQVEFVSTTSNAQNISAREIHACVRKSVRRDVNETSSERKSVNEDGFENLHDNKMIVAPPPPPPPPPHPST